MIILHPDHLISVTVVADSFTCQRRAVLQDRVKATNDATKPQVYGHVLHEIFQEAMKANRWDSDWLNILIKKILIRYVESLYEIHVELSEAADYLMDKMTALRAWVELFLRVKPSVREPLFNRFVTLAHHHKGRVSRGRQEWVQHPNEYQQTPGN
jgi:DNA replication ATP-dependent helicase Dna2